MSSEWPTVVIDQVCELIVDCVNKTAPIVEQPTPYRMVRTTNIRNGRIDLSSCRFVDKLTYEKWTRRASLEHGDVLLTREAPIGEVGLVDKPHGLFLGQRVMQYRANPAMLLPRFLLYAFLSPALQEQFRSHEGSGSVVSHIRVGDCFKFKMKLPPLTTQTEISALLGALDDCIALLRETNATLEAIAQAIFKSWFVDFDPVHAKAEGRLPEGMDEATATLFPDGFEESELGLIPRGWAWVPYGNLLTDTIGGDWGSEVPDEKNNTKVAIIRGTDIPDLQSGAESRVPIRFTTQRKLLSREVKHGDIILEISGGSKDQPTGRSLYLSDQMLEQFDCPVEPASFCRLLRPQSENVGVLLAQHLTYIYSQGKTWEYQNQSTGISNFQTKHFLENELVALPPAELLSEFAATLTAMIKRSHMTQMRSLAQLRDTLLPRLISGKLRLPECQNGIEETTA
ncbi:restriction endonuclease subunit S [Halothiobacillus sp.]|uniref:restriction endonuclease subunit S n=1 Tax=Halothiobacillus sp. TaxID=1891311 RepID=UPI002629E663|nr:restriction endonuclease subunit S [Halothiobacillus sp.]